MATDGNASKIISERGTPRFRCNNSYRVITWLWLAVYCNTAIAQINSGTIVAFEYSKTKTAFVSDTRTMRSDGQIKDDDCKFVTSQGHFMFAAAGFYGTDKWNVFLPARKAAEADLAPNVPANAYALEKIVSDWGEATLGWLYSRGASEMRQHLSFGGNANAANIITAVFALRVADNSIIYKSATITARDDGTHVSMWLEQRNKRPADNGAFILEAIGFTGIANLFFQPIGQPEFVKTEMQSWRRPEASSVGYKAKRIVEMTIEHAGSNTVGGHANGVLLDSTGVHRLYGQECRQP